MRNPGYARLLVAHLWTEAVRGETPEIHLANSWSHLSALLDIHNTGGANSTCHQIRKQLRRQRIDLYCWCTWLSRQIRKNGPPVVVGWKDLQQRLGTQITGVKAFRFQALRYLETLHDLCCWRLLPNEL